MRQPGRRAGALPARRARQGPNNPGTPRTLHTPTRTPPHGHPTRRRCLAYATRTQRGRPVPSRLTRHPPAHFYPARSRPIPPDSAYPTDRPGGGTGMGDRRYFDPTFYRIILIDQRGVSSGVCVCRGARERYDESGIVRVCVRVRVCAMPACMPGRAEGRGLGRVGCDAGLQRAGRLLQW